MYKLRISKSAVKELSKLPKKQALRLSIKINALSENPRPKGCIKLIGSKNEYRIRIGNYRVLYVIEDSVLLVNVIKVGDRKDVY